MEHIGYCTNNFTLCNGNLAVEYPDKITESDAEDIEKFLQLIIHVVRRKVAKKTDDWKTSNS